jgi:hypothetical protein
MTAEFPFKVGDKVIRSGRPVSPGIYFEITAIGESYFLAKMFSPQQSIYEERFAIRDGWERYPEPVVYPERWMAVSRDFVGTPRVVEYAARDDLLAHHRSDRRIGILHLHPDGTTTMEAP